MKPQPLPVPKCRDGQHPINKWAITYPTPAHLADGICQPDERIGTCVNCYHTRVFTHGRLQTASEMDEKKWWNQ